MTPYLWDDGLDVQALAAVRAACAHGIRDGPRCLADLESRGARSPVAREIVRRLAHLLAIEAATQTTLESLARPRLALAPPELN
jgi:methylphosphotriester-DNA--protein-cysteine methyltransferase